MNFEIRSLEARGARISVSDNGVEVGRAYVYLMYIDLHDQPFALMENVYVHDSYRSKGVGGQLVKQVVELAQKANCYKLIAASDNSRFKVNEIYTTWQVSNREK